MSKITKPSTLTKPIRKNIPANNIKFKCSLTNTIYDVLKNRGWQEVTGEDETWDFFWCDREWLAMNYDKTYLSENNRICHFRNHFELTRKNLMVKNLKRMKKKIEKEEGKSEAEKINFFPSTFELPSEYHMFLEEFKKSSGFIWIMKPVAKSQGKGIFLFKKLKDIEAWKRGEYPGMSSDPTKEVAEPYVVSRYIDKPYLINGRKFDLRIYALVVSYNPLKVWLYRDGFARFSNTRFTLNSIDDIFIHLTNVAIQKTAPDYDPEKGCKWSIIKLRRYLISLHGIEKIENLFRSIDNIIITSLTSVRKVIINDKHCFELYGYDILLDEDLRPWLLEINAAPSLTASSKEDYRLKCELLDDVLNVIDMEGRLTGKEKRIGGFDLLWNDGPVNCMEVFPNMISNNYSFNSFLGCEIDRENQLKSIFPQKKIKAFGDNEIVPA